MNSNIFAGILLLVCATTSVYSAQVPIFQCELYGSDCIFKNIRLNTTNFEWNPTCTNPLAVRTVIFRECTIPVLTRAICEEFPLLQSLEMDNQGIQSIGDLGLKNCTELIELNLNSNSIQNVNDETFIHTTRLRTINLGNNKISSLDDDTFVTMNRLSTLNLENNNLKEFSPKLLEKNPILSNLHLHSNDLKDLDVESIVKPTIIREFTVDDNEISCSRLVDILNVLFKRGINPGKGHSIKDRDYETQVVYGDYRCKP